MSTWVVEPVGSPREAEYLKHLAMALDGPPTVLPMNGAVVEPMTIRLRPSRRNRRVSEVQVLFRLSDVAGCSFAINMGPGPAHTHEDPEEWAQLVAINLRAALATKRRLPKDCVKAADADGITWF